METTPQVPGAAPDQGGLTQAYQPTAEEMQSAQVIDEAKLIAEAERFYTQKLQDRRPFDMQWYLNAAALRGHYDAKWNPATNRLDLREQPSYRKRFRINRIRVKYQAMLSKFVNTQPRPIVIASSTDPEDVYNARATERALLYIHRKLDLESKFEAAAGWGLITGKSFIWVRWDTNETARIVQQNAFGDSLPQEATVGEVAVDVGTAFEVLVDDDGIEKIGDQPRIMRVKAERLRDFEGRHPRFKGKLVADANQSDLFQFQRQIADLGARALAGLTPFDASTSNSSKQGDGDDGYILRKEMFEAPCPTYPKGRYWLVAGRQLIEYREQLPYGFDAVSANPYPVEEFSVSWSPGQFWPSTMVEQLIQIQDEYNDLRSKIGEKLELSMFPKLLTPKQARVNKNSYSKEPNEKIEYHYIPGMPPPSWQDPGRIDADAWRVLDMIRQEFDEVTNIYPASLGGAGQATSGFQTNLLQEAADQVHGPDKRRVERAMQGVYLKIRHLMKLGYDIPRLVAAVGRGSIPEVLEFSESNIDPYADIAVQIGSGLSDFKPTRIQQILELHGAGMFGPAGDPNVNRRVLNALDLGGIEQDLDVQRRDEEEARLENIQASKGQDIRPPMPWQNHEMHANVHIDQLKSPEFLSWPEPAKIGLVRHTVQTMVRLNPQLAMEIAQVFAQQDLIAQIAPLLMPPPMAGPPGAAPPGAPSAEAAPPGPAGPVAA
jgi:hypothetical protein